ncbi:hypothetical protein BJV78DRAFT_1157310 [Lactifluus subvellereus]|nr:hypothetical protein BJV78DRAFT_1157310 [Lactifluus subvellereus]
MTLCCTDGLVYYYYRAESFVGYLLARLRFGTLPSKDARLHDADDVYSELSHAGVNEPLRVEGHLYGPALNFAAKHSCTHMGGNWGPDPWLNGYFHGQRRVWYRFDCSEASMHKQSDMFTPHIRWSRRSLSSIRQSGLHGPTHYTFPPNGQVDIRDKFGSEAIAPATMRQGIGAANDSYFSELPAPHRQASITSTWHSESIYVYVTTCAARSLTRRWVRREKEGEGDNRYDRSEPATSTSKVQEGSRSRGEPRLLNAKISRHVTAGGLGLASRET